MWGPAGHRWCVRGVPAYVYVPRIQPARLAVWKSLRACEPGEGPDVVVGEAPARQSVCRGLVRPAGVPACDVLEVWAVVQSCPETGLAILNAGKRDVSTDWGLPVALKVCPAGSREPRDAPADWLIDKLNDQHAYLRLNDGGDALQVGDRVALGISHPCTTFDKWRWMAVVDESYTIVDAITTAF